MKLHCGTYDNEDDALDALDRFENNPDIGEFITTVSDGSAILTGHAIGSREYSCNDSVTVSPRVTFDVQLIDKIPLIPNKSKDNDAYMTTVARHIVGSDSIDIPNINNVRVQTPIYNKLLIDSPSLNQLENLSGIPSGYKLVTLGDDFTVTLKLDGPTDYYDSITNDIKKYVKRVKLVCGVCRSEIVDTTENIQSTYVHHCEVKPYGTTDLTTCEITSTVWVENISKGGPDKTQERITNEPDDYYIITQSKGVVILGKIYDLQVRATDDPSWKLKNAEKLSALPTGEKGDNSVTTNKYGIKLGYRAYFDLKTLGSATNAINITPKIYYVDSNGNNLTNTVDLYYRTSANEYKKLSDEDITIKMNMSNTRGSDFNSLFTEECAKMLNIFTQIKYNKELNIGGLKKLVLTEDNSTLTKYKFKDGTFDYISNPAKNSRRWYGEVRVPASTIVAEKGATVTDIARGQKIKKTGYLIVVFENIETSASGRNNYLQYSMGRKADGTQFSPVGTNLVSPSIMYNEKTNDGMQSLKATIKLPNGKTFSAYPQTDAPIVVYDVSQRANNDFESTGTH